VTEVFYTSQESENILTATPAGSRKALLPSMCQNPSAAVPIRKSSITGFVTIADRLATLKSTNAFHGANACLSPSPSRIRQRMQHRKKFCFAIEKSTTVYAVCNLWGLLEASRNYNYRIMLLRLKITSPKYKMPSYYILYLYTLYC
jgi:hypothetical protein